MLDWQYSINGGSSWQQFPNSNGWSTSTHITGLTENTEYQVQLWCQKEYNHVGGYSDKQNITTLIKPTSSFNPQRRRCKFFIRYYPN